MRNSQVVGGFGGACREMMSPALQRRIAEQEALEAKEAAQEERARAERAEMFQESNLRAAIAAAIERGQDVNPRRLRGEELGHTRSEFIALVSAQQDLEDIQREARRQVAIRKLLQEFDDEDQADVSAHTRAAQDAEQARRDDQRARNQVARGRALRRQRILEDARRASLSDATRLVYAVESTRRGY